MKFEEFGKSFKNPEAEIRCGERQAAKDVTIVGTMLATKSDSCCISVNGTQFEIASSDVIDIQVISPTPPAQTEKTKAAAPAGTPPSPPVLPTVLIKINGGATLICRTPVQAAVLAAAGTWVQVVFPPAETGAKAA